MTFAAFWTAWKSIEEMKNEITNFKVSDLFGNLAFTQIILSLLATFGIYILASLIVCCRLIIADICG